MAESYSWRDRQFDRPTRLPGPDHLGWWVAVAFLLAVLIHIAAFLTLGHVRVALGFEAAEELRTAPLDIQRVEVLPPDLRLIPDTPEPVQPEDAAALLDEIDLLAQLPENTELDLSTEVVDPSFALQAGAPATAEGSPEAAGEVTELDFELPTDLDEMGSTEDPLPPAAEGQITVDPGAVEDPDASLDEVTEEIIRRGNDGNSDEGALDGAVSLDELIGLPEDVLLGSKTMLPSDLLFEYNSAELRESARVGLMKLALLVERNPQLFCWIEGHTDLHGGDAFNLDLSQRRAAAVKSYLVDSLRLDPTRIITRGFGESQPIVAGGSVDEQAPNRRVEIKMRRERPPAGPAVSIEQKPQRVRPTIPPPGRDKPAGTPPRREESTPPAVAAEDPPPRATPVAEPEPAAPRARVVEEPPPARPVEEPAARPVEEPPPARVVEEPAAPPRAIPIPE